MRTALSTATLLHSTNPALRLPRRHIHFHSHLSFSKHPLFSARHCSPLASALARSYSLSFCRVASRAHGFLIFYVRPHCRLNGCPSVSSTPVSVAVCTQIGKTNHLPPSWPTVIRSSCSCLSNSSCCLFRVKLCQPQVVSASLARTRSAPCLFLEANHARRSNSSSTKLHFCKL